MNRSLFVLVVSFLLVLNSSAQDSKTASTEKEKKPAKNSIQNPGMNKASAGRIIQGPARKTSIKSPDPKTQPVVQNTLNAYAGSSEKTPVEAPVLYNYQKLPSDVKQQLDANKAAGRPTMFRIGKRYDISVPSIQSANDFQSALTTVNKQYAILKSVYVSPGRIYIVARPEVASEQIKALLSASNLSFDFLQEQFQLIQ